MEKIRFHFDVRCPWCYQTSRWIHRLDELGVIEADWGVFSLEVVQAHNDGTDPETIDAVSGPALRTAIVIRDKEGSRAIGPFYRALGKRMWEQPPPIPVITAIRESLTEAGLDEGLLDKALADPATWSAVVREHQDVVDQHGAFGVPTIVLDGGTGPAIFGPVIAELPDDETAIELWKHVSWLARYENFSELKRHRPTPPDLEGVRWMMEQKAKVVAQAN